VRPELHACEAWFDAKVCRISGGEEEWKVDYVLCACGGLKVCFCRRNSAEADDAPELSGRKRPAEGDDDAYLERLQTNKLAYQEGELDNSCGELDVDITESDTSPPRSQIRPDDRFLYIPLKSRVSWSICM
jgi:hypothetical protein